MSELFQQQAGDAATLYVSCYLKSITFCKRHTEAVVAFCSVKHIVLIKSSFSGDSIQSFTNRPKLTERDLCSTEQSLYPAVGVYETVKGGGELPLLVSLGVHVGVCTSLLCINILHPFISTRPVMDEQ